MELSTTLMDPDSSDEMIDHLVDFFDRIAPSYDSWAGGQHERVATRLVDVAAPQKGEHVLDVGTGTGLVAHLVAPRVNPGSVIGIDLSDNMLALARSKQSKNVQFLGMAAERLIFKPETFDLVTMGDALAYVSDPTDALAEAHRVLRTGGRLAVSNQRRSLSTRAQDLFFQGLAPLARRHYLSLPRYSSERSRFGEPNVLPPLLDRAGFEVTRMTEMVTGGRTRDAKEWTDLMAGAGPLPNTLIRALGPRYRDELEAEVESAMDSLGDPDDAFRYHHSYLIAVARKR
ncbi:MAG TPA: methyltransferase domain-containing protein [Candidatus Acidoferrum sp.]|nr:methyltransferase domain-containing protein [Candidatus Angelobacter sp.]HXD82498.1 methyltransferase domain-containing protein [Candidatus Acidoferrum sp.]